MAYNNYSYQTYPYSPQAYSYSPQAYAVQQANNAPQPNNSIIWVQGEAGAKSYLVAPNSTVTLWDTESETIYVKSADASGMPNMKVLDYKVRGNAVETTSIPMQNGFATKDDLNALREDLNALRARIEEGADK